MIKVRTIRRKGSDTERWDITALNDMKGTPWEPQLGVDSIEIYSKIKLRELRQNEAETEPRIPKGVTPLVRKNRLGIIERDIRKHGMP